MAFLLNCIRLDRSRTKTRNQVTIVLNCDAKREESEDDDGSDGFATPRIHNWNQVERMTSNFAQVIGSGGYSKVYLGRLPSSTQVAVKIHLGSRLFYQVFKQELEILLRLDHHNTVNLLGYCDDSEEGALVFEYLAGGNLQEQLQGSSRVALPWRKRTVIAFQLTQAIEYLHEKCSPHIIHGDIKSSNILLDQKQNCKLCDFGSAKLGFCSMVLPPKMSPRSRQKMMIGSPGYADPHYLRTGIASKKNDIYALGVVILELVSGKEAFSPERGQMLVHEASPLLKDIAEIETDFEMDKVAKFVDPRLGEEYDIEEAKELLLVAAGCLCQPPSLSPSATQILQDLEDKVPSVFYSVSKDLD